MVLLIKLNSAVSTKLCHFDLWEKSVILQRDFSSFVIEMTSIVETDFSSGTRRNDSCPKVEMTVTGFVITSLCPKFFGSGPRVTVV